MIDGLEGGGGLLQAFLCDRWAGCGGGGGGLLQTFLCDRWARGVFCNLSYVSVCARCGNMGRGVRDKDANRDGGDSDSSKNTHMIPRLLGRQKAMTCVISNSIVRLEKEKKKEKKRRKKKLQREVSKNYTLIAKTYYSTVKIIKTRIKVKIAINAKMLKVLST